MSEEAKQTSVYEVMKEILWKLHRPEEQRHRDLAAFRNSIGRDYEDAPEVWPILLPLLPEAFLGNGALTQEEKAIYVALQLYAVSQQGTNKMAYENGKSRMNMGASLRNIRGMDSQALDRRFNAMLTSSTFEEFTYHLRQIFKLGRSKNAFAVDFPTLANDLFWYQNGKSKQVCLNWAKEYYRIPHIDENESAVTADGNEQKS